MEPSSSPPSLQGCPPWRRCQRSHKASYEFESHQDRADSISHHIARTPYGEEDPVLLLRAATTDICPLLSWSIRWRLVLCQKRQRLRQVTHDVSRAEQQKKAAAPDDDGYDNDSSGGLDYNRVLKSIVADVQIGARRASNALATKKNKNKSNDDDDDDDDDNDLLWMKEPDESTESKWNNRDWLLQNWASPNMRIGLARYLVWRDVLIYRDRWTTSQKHDMEIILSCADQIMGIEQQGIIPAEDIWKASAGDPLAMNTSDHYLRQSPIEVCRSYQELKEKRKRDYKQTKTQKDDSHRVIYAPLHRKKEFTASEQFRFWVISVINKSNAHSDLPTNGSVQNMEAQQLCRLFGSCSWQRRNRFLRRIDTMLEMEPQDREYLYRFLQELIQLQTKTDNIIELQGRAILVTFLISKDFPGYQNAQLQLVSPLLSIRSVLSEPLGWSRLENAVHECLLPTTRTTSSHVYRGRGHCPDRGQGSESDGLLLIPDVKTLVVQLWDYLILRREKQSRQDNLVSVVTKFASWMPSDPIVVRYKYLLRCVLRDSIDTLSENQINNLGVSLEQKTTKEWKHAMRVKIQRQSPTVLTNLVVNATKFLRGLTEFQVKDLVPLGASAETSFWSQMLDYSFCKDTMLPLLHGISLVSSSNVEKTLAPPTLARFSMLCSILECIICAPDKNALSGACPQLLWVINSIGDTVFPSRTGDTNEAVVAIVIDNAHRLRNVVDAVLPSIERINVPLPDGYLDSIVDFCLSSSFSHQIAPFWCRYVSNVILEHCGDKVTIQWINSLLSCTKDGRTFHFTPLLLSVHEGLLLHACRYSSRIKPFDKEYTGRETTTSMVNECIKSDTQPEVLLDVLIDAALKITNDDGSSGLCSSNFGQGALLKIIHCTPPLYLFPPHGQSSTKIVASAERALQIFGKSDMKVACAIFAGLAVYISDINPEDTSVTNECCRIFGEYLNKAGPSCGANNKRVSHSTNALSNGTSSLCLVSKHVRLSLLRYGSTVGLEWWERVCSNCSTVSDSVPLFSSGTTSTSTNANKRTLVDTVNRNLQMLLEEIEGGTVDTQRVGWKRQRYEEDEEESWPSGTNEEDADRRNADATEYHATGKSRNVGLAQIVLQDFWGRGNTSSLKPSLGRVVNDVPSNNELEHEPPPMHKDEDSNSEVVKQGRNGHEDDSDDDCSEEDDQILLLDM